jgi:hypothetical protein
MVSARFEAIADTFVLLPGSLGHVAMPIDED